MPFFVITACVSIAEGILGMIYYSDMYLPYNAMFSPALFGIATSFPSLVLYSKKELSVRQLVIREIIHALLVETTVFLLNYFAGNIKSVSVAVSLAATVLIIIAAVDLIEYINDRRVADELNEALKKIR